MKAGWRVRKLGELGVAIREQAKIESNREYELWSVPSFESGTPETSFGKDIGSAKLRVRPNDVLICKINPRINRVWLVSKPMDEREQIGSTEWLVYRALSDAELSPNWLIHFVSAPEFREWIASEVSGATGSHTRAKTDEIMQQVMPVPPLPEQQRIVTLLDEAFDGIATAKANAAKNLQNTRELFGSQAQAMLDVADKDWERVTLSDLLERGWIVSHLDGNHGGDYPRKEEFVDSGVPYISAKALKDGQVDFDESKYLSVERAATIRKGLAKDRDVLFAHNATVGPVAILSTDEDVVILGTSLTYYRCDQKNIHPEYLAHFMRSPPFVNQYSQVMGQSTRNQVPITKQREFFHVIPPFEDQFRIASSLDILLEQTERLDAIYQQKLTALDELKKSLLHRAFNGEL